MSRSLRMRPTIASSLSRNICTHRLTIWKPYSRRHLLSGSCGGGLSNDGRQHRLLSSRQPRATAVKKISMSPSSQQKCLSRFSGPTAEELSLLDTVWFPPQESAGPKTLSEAELSKFLLEKFDNPKFSKVIHYQDRRTALERAIQVACEGTRRRYGWEKPLDSDGNEKQLGILKLEGSLYGDLRQKWNVSTGHFAEDSPVTEPRQNGNGLFYKAQRAGQSFKFPCLKRKKGGWKIEPPKGMKRQFTRSKKFARLGEVFDIQSRLTSPAALRYRHYFEEHFKEALIEGRRFGAVVLEPVLTGHHTKSFVDPLFQYIFVQVVRDNPQLFTPKPFSGESDTEWAGLPIIFSETSGPDQRLGRFTSASLLQVQPDMSLIHTARGTLEGDTRSTTLLMSSSFYNDFEVVQSKIIQNNADLIKDTIETEDSDAALLQVIEEAWGNYLPSTKPRKDKGDAPYQIFKEDWEFENDDIEALTDGDGLWSIWSNDFVYRAAQSIRVRSLMTLGSVLTITVRLAQPQNPLTGLTFERFAALKSEISEISGKNHDIHFRCAYETITLWPKNDMNVEVLSQVQTLLEDVLLGNTVTTLYEGDGMYEE